MFHFLSGDQHQHGFPALGHLHDNQIGGFGEVGRCFAYGESCEQVLTAKPVFEFGACTKRLDEFFSRTDARIPFQSLEHLWECYVKRSRISTQISIIQTLQ